MNHNPYSWRPRAAQLQTLATLFLALACNDNQPDQVKAPKEPAASGPFKSVEAVANAPSLFSSPRAGVPLSGGRVAFIATLEDRDPSEDAEGGERRAVLLQPSPSAAPRVIYSGDALQNPLDLALSLDEKTFYIADPAAGADGLGAVLSLPVNGGDPSELISGLRPRAVTVAEDGAIFFSGTDLDGAPAVFGISGASANSVYSGPPLVDPSCIAVQRDGTLLVADTRLSDGDSAVASEAGVVRIADGSATIFASGFATGYPAGIALTVDEKVLIVSGEGPDRSDTVYLVEMVNPTSEPRAVTASFSAYQDSSAGLKRAHQSNTFVWASLAADGGTVFRIEAN